MKNTALPFFLLSLVIIGMQPVWASKITVVLNTKVTPYNSALQGIKSNSALEIETLDLNNAGSLAALPDSPTDLLVAIGSDAINATVKLKPEIPFCYTMVLEPYKSSRPISGVLMRPGAREQLALIRKIFPQRKTIGVAYFSSDYSAQDINDARTCAPEFGFTLVPLALQHPDDIPVAINKFTPDTIDVIWMVFNTDICNPASVNRYIQQSYKTKLPLICPAANHAKAGALLAFTADYYDMGQQLGALIKANLANKNLSKVETPRKIEIYLNRNVQNQLGINDLVALPEMKLIQ